MRAEMGSPRLLWAGDGVARAIVIVSAAAVLIFCLVALDRGFEITDESYYLLLGMHPEAVRLYVSGQQWVMGPLWQVTGSLVSFRAMGLFILVGSSIVLATGTWVAFEERGARFSCNDRTLIVFASIVGALLYIATINLSPSYNLLASAGSYLAAGFTLLALYARGFGVRVALLMFVGVSLCVAFVSKPSSGVAIFVLLSLWMLLLGRTLREGVHCILASGFLFVISIVALALSQSTPADIQTGLANGVELFRMIQTESIGARLLRYVTDIFGHAGQALLSFWAVFLGVGVYLFTRRPVVIAITLAALAFTLQDGGYLLGGADQYVIQIKAALVLLLTALAVVAPVWMWDRRLTSLILGLVALPYAIAFGSGNSMFTQIIVSMAPWGALIAALTTLVRVERADRTLSLALLAAFALTLASQIVTSGFRAPYHLAEPLDRQTEPVDVGGLGHFRVDAGTATFLRNLDAAITACGITPGAPFLGLFDIPGVALALRVVPVVTPWLNNAAQAELALALGPPDVLRSAVVAIRDNPDGSRVALPAALSAFPAGFEFCGTAIYPFGSQRIEIWHAAPG